MIVAKPTWTRRPKRYHTLWCHEWHEVPWSAAMRVQSGYVRSTEYRADEYVAAVYSHGERTDLGTLPTLEAAQAACDALCAERLGAGPDEAIRNWRTWTKDRRAAAKREREARQRENEVKLSPEARERCRKLAEALGAPGGRRA